MIMMIHGMFDTLFFLWFACFRWMDRWMDCLYTIYLSIYHICIIFWTRYQQEKKEKKQNTWKTTTKTAMNSYDGKLQFRFFHLILCCLVLYIVNYDDDDHHRMFFVSMGVKKMVAFSFLDFFFLKSFTNRPTDTYHDIHTYTHTHTYTK